MKMKNAVNVLRHRWWIVLAGVVVGAIVGAGVSLASPTRYTATARLFVSTTGGSTSTEAYQGDQFSQQRTDSYAHILDSAILGQRVAETLGLPLSGDEVAAKVDAATVPKTVLIDVAVTDDTADRAAQIANTLAEEFIAYITPLETPTGQDQARVAVTLVNPAEAPGDPTSLGLPKGIVFGALLGGLLGLIAAAVVHAADTRVRDVPALAAAAGLPVLGPVDVPQRSFDQRTAQLTTWNTVEAEGFRKVRASLQHTLTDGRIILVAAAVPGRSASASALDLAAAFAEAEEPTIVVDVDPANPIAAAGLDLAPAPGLGEVCAGAIGADDAIQATANPYLHVLTAGADPRLPALLAAPAMPEALARLREHYGTVVLSAPAVPDASAAAVLTPLANLTLLIAYRKAARHKDVRGAQRELTDAGSQRLSVLLVE